MKKKYIIISILLSIVILLTGTYAYLTWSSKENTNFTFHLGEVGEVIFSGGNEISANGIGPVLSPLEESYTEFQIVKKTEDPFTITIDFLPTTLPEELKEESFKYVLYSKTNEKDTYSYVTEGNFLDKEEGSQFTISKEELTQTTYYQLFIYIDGNMLNPSDMRGKNFEGKVIVSYKSSNSLFSEVLMNLYTDAEKTTVVNNGINYEYAKSVSMMKDVGGNIRYYGADPDNYIYFNCTDYTNQSDSTCEKWRIIGIFDDKIKIMRNESIGKYSWDTSEWNGDSDDTLTGYGINQWGPSTYTDGTIYGGADLMKLLNPGYDSNQDLDSSGNTIIVNNSLYYTGGNGNCYNGIRNATATCNFTTTGLKNDITRGMISETLYYLGASGSRNVYSDQFYEYERGELTGRSDFDKVNRTTTWTGKIGLPYVSDYGYAADLRECNKTLDDYSNSACTSNNWMQSTLGTFNRVHLITPVSNFWHRAWFTYNNSVDYEVNTTGHRGDVHPVLYLISEITIDQEVGTGDVNSPYQIKIS